MKGTKNPTYRAGQVGKYVRTAIATKLLPQNNIKAMTNKRHCKSTTFVPNRQRFDG